MQSIERDGEIIKAARQKKGVSQYELAKRLGITRSSVCNTERCANLKIATLRRVAKALGLTLRIELGD